MSKRQWEVSMVSYGIYCNWNKDSHDLPEIVKFTAEIPCSPKVEFGYILNIKKAKGVKISFRMIHPPFKNSAGQKAPDFTGELYVKSNDWDFYLGDTFWEPLEDKVGTWRLLTELDGEVIADKTFIISPLQGHLYETEVLSFQDNLGIDF